MFAGTSKTPAESKIVGFSAADRRGGNI